MLWEVYSEVAHAFEDNIRVVEDACCMHAHNEGTLVARVDEGKRKFENLSQASSMHSATSSICHSVVGASLRDTLPRAASARIHHFDLSLEIQLSPTR